MSMLNLAGRAGRWSAAHWKRALFGWLVFAIAAMVIGGVVGHVQMKDSDYASGEDGTAIRMLQGAGLIQPATENILCGDPNSAILGFTSNHAITSSCSGRAGPTFVGRTTSRRGSTRRLR